MAGSVLAVLFVVGGLVLVAIALGLDVLYRRRRDRRCQVRRVRASLTWLRPEHPGRHSLKKAS